MADDDPKNLSLRAYLALQGASLDWRGDLAELMRSDVPLDRMLRDRLADAIENQGGEGPSIELNNHKEARDRFAGVASRHEWMEIGRWIEGERQRGVPKGASLEAAERHFGVGIKAAEKALTYYNRAKLWIDGALKSEAGQALGRDTLERLYHSITVRPEMKRVNADLIRQLGLSHRNRIGGSRPFSSISSLSPAGIRQH